MTTATSTNHPAGMTGTGDAALRWTRCYGANPGVESQYGSWSFRVYAWQRGSYLAVATCGHASREFGANAGEIPTLTAEGKAFCEQVFRDLRDADRRAGITRGW